MSEDPKLDDVQKITDALAKQADLISAQSDAKLIEAIKQIADGAIAGDSMVLGLVQEVIDQVIEHRKQITQLMDNDIEQMRIIEQLSKAVVSLNEKFISLDERVRRMDRGRSTH